MLPTEANFTQTFLQDSSVIMHTLRRGTYVRSLYHPDGLPVHSVALSRLGHILVYSAVDHSLLLYNINGACSSVVFLPFSGSLSHASPGKLLASQRLGEAVNHMLITKDAEYLILGHANQLVVRRLYDLQVHFIRNPYQACASLTFFPLQFLHQFITNSAVRYVAITNEQRHVMVALDDGKLLIVALDLLAQ